MTQLTLPFDARDAMLSAMRAHGGGFTFRDAPADVLRHWDDLMAEIYAGAKRKTEATR